MATTDYPIEVSNKLANEKKNMGQELLREHQYIFLKYFTEISLYKRGILAFHGTGTGKTITAEAVVDFYRKNDPGRDVVLLMSKSLVDNFKGTVRMYMKNNPHAEEGEKSEEFIERVVEKYKFISLGASNMFEQVKRTADMDILLQRFMDSEKALEGKLLVIDEVHNLANSISNGSKNGVKLYDLIMRTKDIRLIFLTATPMINTPFELVPLLNMIRGPIKTSSGTFTLLPENFKEFNNLFIKNGRIHNKDKLMNRIYGLISYYGSEYLSKSLDYPEQKDTIVVRVPMSEYQFAQYETMRAVEKKEDENKIRKATNAERFSDKGSASSSYRVKSRQVSNFAFPEDTYTFINSIFKKFPEKITDDHLRSLNKYSPKLQALLKNLNGKGKDVIYSQFLPRQLERILRLNGYDLWTFTTSAKPGKKFAIISGEIPAEIRTEIVKVWNSAENMQGELLKVLIITATGAEGLDLKHGRRVHILEPFWNEARHEQVIARINRYKSHVDLPANEQNVQPYIYISDYPANYPDKKKKELTTDADIYENALKAKTLINDFVKMLIEVSIDCEVLATTESRKKYNCMLCTPNHMALSQADINVDMQMPNRCHPPKKSTKKVKEILLPGVDKKFYYNNEDTLKIYSFNDTINAYVLLEKDDENYVELARAILLNGD
jgi:SNF2 family DNA or RNA helicase